MNQNDSSEQISQSIENHHPGTTIHLKPIPMDLESMSEIPDSPQKDILQLNQIERFQENLREREMNEEMTRVKLVNLEINLAHLNLYSLILYSLGGIIGNLVLLISGSLEAMFGGASVTALALIIFHAYREDKKLAFLTQKENKLNFWMGIASAFIYFLYFFVSFMGIVFDKNLLWGVYGLLGIHAVYRAGFIMYVKCFRELKIVSLALVRFSHFLAENRFFSIFSAFS